MKQRVFKSRIGHAALLALVVWLALGSPAGAQGILVVNIDAVDAGAHPTMRALVTVTDENGLPVRGLGKSAFELNDDGRGTFQPDQVEVVANQKAAVSVAIVVDLSSTMRGAPLQAVKDATAKFLEALLNEPNDPDRAAFIGFTHKVNPTEIAFTDESREVNFTNDMGRLLNVVNFVEVDTVTGGTPLYDAIYRAVKITAQQPGRRVILLMTDGKDQGSTLTGSDPIDEANRQRIPIFPVGLSTGWLDTQYLQRVAVRTGGQFQSAKTPDELTQLFQNVLAQLKEQYVLTFTSRIPQMDGQQHTLSVQVTTLTGSSSGKFTYVLGQPTTPAPGAGAATPAPAATPVPSASPIPQPPGGFNMTPIFEWINNNLFLAIAIAAAACLLFLILLIAIALIVRRRGAPQPEEGVYAQPEGATFPGAAPGADRQAAISSMPTVAPAGPATGPSIPSAKTQMAGSVPPAPTPFQPAPFQPAPPPAPFQPAPAKPAAAPPPGAGEPVAPIASGKTVVIQRGPKLKVLGMLVDKKQSSKRFDIDKPTVTLGRAPGNDVIVDNPTVSRQHAAIKLEGNDFRLYDLGSANGTFVNDQRVHEPITLQDGMTVRLGEVEFIFKRVTLE